MFYDFYDFINVYRVNENNALEFAKSEHALF